MICHLGNSVLSEHHCSIWFRRTFGPRSPGLSNPTSFLRPVLPMAPTTENNDRNEQSVLGPNTAKFLRDFTLYTTTNHAITSKRCLNNDACITLPVLMTPYEVIRFWMKWFCTHQNHLPSRSSWRNWSRHICRIWKTDQNCCCPHFPCHHLEYSEPPAHHRTIWCHSTFGPRDLGLSNSTSFMRPALPVAPTTDNNARDERSVLRLTPARFLRDFTLHMTTSYAIMENRCPNNNACITLWVRMTPYGVESLDFRWN